LVIDCPPEDVDVYEKNTEEVMLENIPQLKVPLEVTVKVVDNWGAAKD
jgi:DNA polymerase I-like protein with 3'-5' exonuclease and polymerase domains